MADEEDRGEPSPAGGIEMTTVDLSSPQPPRQSAPESPPVVR